ncbi:MAG: twin-arginine translocation signal domain-containing protein, partial [Eggerthella lenta]
MTRDPTLPGMMHDEPWQRRAAHRRAKMGNERITTMKHNENGTNGQNKANRGLSRRTFLTGAAVTGLAAAGALAGCSPKS